MIVVSGFWFPEGNWKPETLSFLRKPTKQDENSIVYVSFLIFFAHSKRVLLCANF